MFSKIISGNLDENVILWKYMDVSKFISLLSQKSLWLARSDTFKDRHGGKFHLEMEQSLKEIYEKLNQLNQKERSATINSADDFQKYLVKNSYINCWHKNLNENMVMWEIYGQTENSVAIRTTAKQLRESLDLSEIKKIGLEMAFDEVSYKSAEEVNGQLYYRAPFFIKRPHFSFENEVRLFLSMYSRYEPSLNTPLGYSIPINLIATINDIYVHPDAQDWFLKAIQDIVYKFDLSIIVKRGLYGNQEV